MHRVSDADQKRVIKVDADLKAKLEKAFAKSKVAPKPSADEQGAQGAGGAAANRGRSNPSARGGKFNILDLTGVDWANVFAPLDASKALMSLELQNRAVVDVMELIAAGEYDGYIAVQEMLLGLQADFTTEQRQLTARLASLAEHVLIASPEEPVLGEKFLERLHTALKEHYFAAEKPAADLPPVVNFLYQLREGNATLMLPLAAHREQTTELKWMLHAFRRAYRSVHGVCKVLAKSGSVRTLRDNLYTLARHMLPMTRAKLKNRLALDPDGLAWDFPAFVREVKTYKTTAKDVARHTLLYFLVTAVRQQKKNKDNWLQAAANTLHMQSEKLRDSSIGGVLALKMITVKTLDAALYEGPVQALQQAVLDIGSPLRVAAIRLTDNQSLTTARVAEVDACRDALTGVLDAQINASHSYDALCEVLGMKSATKRPEREDALVALDILEELLATAMKQSPEPGP